MHHLDDDTADTSAVKPTKGAAGVAGYFVDQSLPGTPGTVVPATLLNSLMDEVINVIEDVGLDTLDVADDTQMAQALGGARAIKAHATDTGSVSTGNTRTVIASTTSQASGNNAAAVAATSAVVSGANAAVLASSGGHTASGNRTAIIACDETGAPGGPAVNSGLNSAIIGCSGPFTNSDTNCVVIASQTDNALNTSALATNNECLAGGKGADWKWQILSTTGTAIFEGGSGAGPADFAEWFPRVEEGDPLMPGTLLTREGRKVRPATLGDRVVGTVSADPAFLGNYGKGSLLKGHGPTDETHAKVALTGQVPVLIDSLVQTDHYLVAGARAGVATSAGSLRPPSGRSVECMEILEPYDEARGYGIALCLVG